MKLATPITALIIVTSFMFSCATGPKFAELKPNLTASSPEQGRIFFYRPTGIVYVMVKPDVMLNGERVGEAVPQGFFYVDRPAGKYVATTFTNPLLSVTHVESQVSFILEKGQTRFVRFTVPYGGDVTGDLADQEDALEEIQNCRYAGEIEEKKQDEKK